MRRKTCCSHGAFVLGLSVLSGCGGTTSRADRQTYDMIALTSGAGDGMACTDDRKWCVQLARVSDKGVKVSVMQDGLWVMGADVLADADADADADAGAVGATDREIWPFLITGSDVLPDVLVGIISTINVGYSGGGAEAHFLDLIRLDAGGDPVAGTTSPGVLSVPLGAMKMIRACFDEDDVQKRRDVCHDEYRFEADIRLGNHGAAGLPDLLYTSTATAFPATVSLDQDSTQLPALRDQDLVERVDERCSFERVFRFDVTSGRYQPDAPLPDCDDYLIP